MIKCSRSALYPSIALAICLWWYCFLVPSSIQAPPTKTQVYEQGLPLSPLTRHELQEALQGELTRIHELLGLWRMEADRLEEHGVPGVQRLTEEKQKEAFLLAHTLLHIPPEQRKSLDIEYTQKTVYDDVQAPIHTGSAQRFLPQTFCSAHILMALVGPQSLIALPSGLTSYPKLFPESFYEQVPLEANRYLSEELYREKPDLAFAAFYSLPSVLHTLKQQGTPLFMLDQLDTPEQVAYAVERLGQVSRTPLKGRLLALFTEAALMALDNRLLALRYQEQEQSLRPLPKLLFLRRYTNYTLPPFTSLTRSLLERHTLIHWIPHKPANARDNVSLSQEELSKLNPDCLIFSSHTPKEILDFAYQDPALKNLEAVKKGRLYAVHAQLQDEPSQFFILGYYDICQCLAEDLGCVW